MNSTKHREGADLSLYGNKRSSTWTLSEFALCVTGGVGQGTGHQCQQMKETNVKKRLETTCKDKSTFKNSQKRLELYK